MENFFSTSFNNLDELSISNSINKDSFFSEEKAVNENIVDKLLEEVDLFNLKPNSLDISAVHADDGYYMSSGLAKSETLYNLLTSEKIMKISKNYLGDKFRLKCHRVYSVSPGVRKPWHTDDKKYGSKTQNKKGLVFMIYLNDVFHGEFQVIKSSHLFSSDFEHPNFDEDVIRDFKDKVVSFKYPKGSIIIFDNKAIHRAKPYFNYFWKRKSLFFQIDDEINDGEKIIINTRFVKKIDDNIINYLGLGKSANMPHEPAKTQIETLNFLNIFKFQKKILFAIIKRIIFLMKSFLTGDFKRRIQIALGLKTSVNSKKINKS
jgi:hypothetical protein